jgi:aryl-alcohol dehydrogenase-like predicted oxidoreductase
MGTPAPSPPCRDGAEIADGSSHSPELSTSVPQEDGWSVLDHELREQKAHTLGALSGQVEQALAALRAFDAGMHEPDQEHRRRALLEGAANLVWAFMIQRELCGLRN